MTILIAGDYCPRHRLETVIARGAFSDVFSEVKILTEKVDYSVVNLECPVVIGDVNPIKKCGPSLKTPKKGLQALQWAGFDCVTLANNHFADFGEKGVSDTIRSCQELGFDYVGGGINISEASRVLYKIIAKQRLAIINCCEHEFSIATETEAGSNPLNPIQQYYTIREAKKNADYVLVIVHGGHEHWQLPSPRMLETYRFFIDAGADVVVNHHQHCFSGYEIYKGKPIFYGLGNFCFDKPGERHDLWVEGYVVSLDFCEEGISYSLYPYRQCAEEPAVKLLPQDAFEQKLQLLNSIIADPKRLCLEMMNFFKGQKSFVCDIFEPFFNRYYLGLKHRGWFPSLIGASRTLSAYDYVFCESHRDSLQYWLECLVNDLS